MSNANTDSQVYWDPYRPDLALDPYPAYSRMRAEAPLYYNEQYDFYAVTRFNDVERCLSDWQHFSSSRSDILEIIKAPAMTVPPGRFIWQDPPLHDVYRNVLARVFTPRRMNSLEGMIRDYCAKCLDPLVGAERIDFIADLGAKLPGGVIGIMLGIPEEDRDEVRKTVEARLRTAAGQPMNVEEFKAWRGFETYLDWREKNPSDDLMSELLKVEFEDETGTTRKLSREEILAFVDLLAGAGNDTTNRLIGWIGKVLGDHPDQRREIAANPALVSDALEEILRFEPPGPSVARYVAQDVEVLGQTVPAGSAMLCIVAAANRDEDRFPNGETFNIHRKGATHITFGRGVHSCLGLALARVEGRVALEEILKRFPDWTVDTDNATLSSSSTTRGWDTLPAWIG